MNTARRTSSGGPAGSGPDGAGTGGGPGAVTPDILLDILVAGSVREVPGAGVVHRDARRLRRLGHLLVPDRTTRVDDSAHARLEQDLQAVREREERVGRRDRTLGALGAGPVDREPAGVD